MKKNVLFIATVSVLLAFYQNCSKVEFAAQEAANDLSSENPNSILGNDIDDEDGIADVDDDDSGSCVSGASFDVWVKPNAALGIDASNNSLGSIVSYKGSRSAADNYNYYSASAHPKKGPVPKGFELHVFMYEGPGGLALNFYANIDSGGSPDNEVDIDIDIDGNTAQDRVLLSDDSGELKKGSNGQYRGRFRYWKNTDGGVIGPLAGNQFVIELDLKDLGDLSTARFYSADGRSFLLKDQFRNINKIYIGYQGHKACP